MSLSVTPTSLSRALNTHPACSNHISSHFILVITQGGGCYPHFTDRKPKAQTGKLPC